MIATIAGTIKEIGGDFLIIEVAGLGYQVFVPTQVLDQKKSGEKVRLFTYQHVREDSLSLYGFEEKDQLLVFKLLISISGIGPRLAMGILSSATPEEVRGAVVSNDLELFTTIPGIGKKNAARIVLELQEKMTTEAMEAAPFGVKTSEVISALANLGFSVKEAREALRKIDKDLSPEEKIKKALKLLAR